MGLVQGRIGRHKLRRKERRKGSMEKLWEVKDILSYVSDYRLLVLGFDGSSRG